MNRNNMICKKIKKSVGNMILMIIYKEMKKKSFIPQTKVKNPEPKKKGIDWVIWAAWADRITFEEIKEKTGNSESDVIKIMRKNLKSSAFRLWRKRVHNTSIKHRKKFKLDRKKLREKIKISDIY
jgi:uncharacterized protein (TIGR03643 family)|tara:strand:- start:497 stop:871 length:375 start_codon:yes stop_codon:yes gene_type:complete